MLRSSGKARKPFKPPVRTSQPGGGLASQQEASSSGGSGKGPLSPQDQDDLERLKAKEAQVDEEIKRLKDKGLKPEQLQEYIKLLHEYNEVKDVAQVFMGRLAIYDEVTLREIASRYDAPEDD